MVTNSGATPGASALRPLNAPRRVEVREDEGGQPQAILLNGAWLEVANIEDAWRLEEEWWRADSLARQYYETNMEDGRRITLFHDLIRGVWHVQKP